MYSYTLCAFFLLVSSISYAEGLIPETIKQLGGRQTESASKMDKAQNADADADADYVYRKQDASSVYRKTVKTLRVNLCHESPPPDWCGNDRKQRTHRSDNDPIE